MSGLRALDELDLDNTFLNEEHRALRPILLKVIAAEALPTADQWELDRRIPAETFRELGELGELGELALLGLSFPQRDGWWRSERSRRGRAQ